MTICTLCSNDMTTGASCVIDTLHLHGQAYPVAPHGGPGSIPARNRPCGDCGVVPGGFHHPGCDLQACPFCGFQLFVCGCPWEELEGHDVRGRYNEDPWFDDPDGWIDEYDDVDDDLDDGFEDDLGEGLDEPGRDSGAGAAERTRRFPVVPFEAAAAPVRAEHHGAVVDLAEWALAAGRPIDRSIAAVFIKLLRLSPTSSVGVFDDLHDDVHDGLTPARPLQRPGVDNVLRIRFFNWCSIHSTLMPEGVPEQVWTVLSWAAATARLHPESDPLPALLEPLQCYGGLDANGRPRPSDALPEIDCQCMLPFDPTLPPGMINRIMAWGTDMPIVERVFAPERHGASLADYAPFLRVADRVSRSSLRVRLVTEEWVFLGQRPAEGRTAALWFYGHEPSARRGFPALAVDEKGTIHVAVPDRRRKAGYRWSAVRDSFVYRSIPITPAPSLSRRDRLAPLRAVPEPSSAPVARSRGMAPRSAPRDQPPRQAG